jgi:hypothetical protein
MMEKTKAWWMSKTIWVNLVALVGSLVISYGFDPAKWAEISTVTLAVINLALRMVTNEGLALQPDQKPSAPTGEGQ